MEAGKKGEVEQAGKKAELGPAQTEEEVRGIEVNCVCVCVCVCV